MQQINSALALVQATAKLARPISSERKPEMRWSESTEKMVILAFTRMADLFGHKAISRGLVIYADSEKGIYSDSFKLWCWKLDDLSAEAFAEGMRGVEGRVTDCYREGREMWPPSYAEFRAICTPATDQDKRAHKILDSVFDPTKAHLFLEDQTERAKRYALGQKESGEILNMLGEKPRAVIDPEQTAQAKEFARIRLEQAKQLLAKKQGV